MWRGLDFFGTPLLARYCFMSHMNYQDWNAWTLKPLLLNNVLLLNVAAVTVSYSSLFFFSLSMNAHVYFKQPDICDFSVLKK